MDMNLIYAMLIALIPVVLAIIFTKIYNIVHGIISFLFFGAILMLCLHIFGDKMPVTMTYFEVFGGFYTGLSGFLCNPSNGLVTFVAYGLLGIFGLGDVVVNNATYAIFTYEDPRSEDPEKICEDIIQNFKDTKDNYEVVIDRRTAIQKAIDMAKEKDMVLILGKGNETYQKLKTETIYFNDVEEAYQAVVNRNIKEEMAK